MNADGNGQRNLTRTQRGDGHAATWARWQRRLTNTPKHLSSGMPGRPAWRKALYVQPARVDRPLLDP